MMMGNYEKSAQSAKLTWLSTDGTKREQLYFEKG
jgi:hypothetical protein